MARFAVTYASLATASAVMLGDEALGPAPSGGAAAGTPAAAAWSQFADAAGRSVADSHQAVGELSRALSLAARIYEIADERSASDLTPVTP